MLRAFRDDPKAAPEPLPRRPACPEPRSVALARLARLFASVDGAVASGDYDQLQEMIARISFALTMAKRAHKNAPAERLHDNEPHLDLARAPSRAGR